MTDNAKHGNVELNEGVVNADRVNAGTYDQMNIGGTPVTSQIALNSDVLAVLESHTHSSTAGAAASFYGAKSRGTNALPTILADGDLVRIDAAVGFDGTDYALLGYAIWSVNGTPGAGDMPGKWSLYTTPEGSETPVVRMSIDQAGFVTFSDSIQVTGNIELGHASDTTISRVSAGNIAVEGKGIYRADGTDVPIADGGTGQSTAQAAIDALTQVSAATNEYVLTKDTATGNAKWKVGGSGSGLTEYQVRARIMRLQ